MIKIRTCSRCKQEKSLEDFVKDKRKLYGFGYSCRECEKKRAYKFWKENSQNILARSRLRYWENREKFLKKNRQDYKNYKKKSKDPLKEKVRDITKYAVKVGHLIRKPCELCGEVKTQAHHSDYNKPLEVMWLCKKHHMEWHRNNVAVPPITPPKNISSNETTV